MKTRQEIARLCSGSQAGEPLPGPLVTVEASCDRIAADVLQEVRELWAIVVWQEEPAKLSEEQWRAILPGWFVGSCVAESDSDGAQESRVGLGNAVACPPLTLGEWMRQVAPPVRSWAWWAANVTAPHAFEVKVTTDNAGADLRALFWMLSCAGARAVEVVR
ncbi:MAG: hypothetical protein JNL39_17375 [Opitutaceae bacterium]|nr:hypothetical protein [Opitutaceae bacterium]